MLFLQTKLPMNLSILNLSVNPSINPFIIFNLWPDKWWTAMNWDLLFSLSIYSTPYVGTFEQFISYTIINW
jgi:hypothetical protein